MLNERWEAISIKFIVELSKFIKFNIVMIVVDLVSKKTYFVSTHITVTIEGTTRLFLYHV